LHHSLTALDRDLRCQGGRLHVLLGDVHEVVPALARALGAVAVYWSHRYEPAEIAEDVALQRILRAQGTGAHSVPGSFWHAPSALTTESGQPYRVFTPFWRKLRAQLQVENPLPAPRPREWVVCAGTESIATLGLLPRIRWDQGLGDTWWPGEVGARARLEIFADRALSRYADARDLPAQARTSLLSPHLHFGEITPRQILHVLRARTAGARAKVRWDLEPFLRQLGWREFACYLLYHFPHMVEANFDPHFDHFDWAPDDAELLARWQRGRTGIPLVDAGMRQLWHSGWMHNRVRMVVASFLTKNLRLHWMHGARWFWDTLVDADLPNNTLGWQWMAGCGPDPAPYFRILNPYLQSAKFDPKAEYLYRWLPELRGVAPKVLHEAWKHTGVLSTYGYPAPIVDVAATREAALAAYARL